MSKKDYDKGHDKGEKAGGDMRPDERAFDVLGRAFTSLIPGEDSDDLKGYKDGVDGKYDPPDDD